MKLFRLLALALIVFSPACLHAQLGLYGAFTVQNLGVPNNNGYAFYGGTFGAYLASGHFALLSAGVDLRGSFSRSGGTSFDSGSIGPRIGLNLPLIPIRPYLEATAGVGHLTLSGGSPSTTKFEYQFLGGLDFTVLPRIDWRIAEFSYGGLSALNNSSYHPKSISTGIVLRLPRFFPMP
jgi:hypothetical protein